jgi:hypothetical protein
MLDCKWRRWALDLGATQVNCRDWQLLVEESFHLLWMGLSSRSVLSRRLPAFLTGHRFLRYRYLFWYSECGHTRAQTDYDDPK